MVSAGVIMGCLIGFTNCTQTPQATTLSGSANFGSSSFTHADKMSSCLPCHIPDRAAPTQGYVHYNNQDCVTCHTPTKWSEHSWHFRNPAQPTCIHCHRKDQPTTTSGNSHYNNQDCITCHQAALVPGVTWASLKNYTHTPSPTSCSSCHEKNRPTNIASHPKTGDCITCHTSTTQW
jgi:hypothetical protein